MDSEQTITAVVSGLFFLSEVLSLIPVRTNGILQTIIMGLKKGFAVNPKTGASIPSEPLTGIITEALTNTQVSPTSQLQECYTQNTELFDKIIATLKSGDQKSIDDLKQKLSS